MQKVTGIGGVFLKARNPQAMMGWYQEHLGVEFNGQSHFQFRWVNQKDPAVPGSTVFSFFPEDTKYFNPADTPFMINFRVNDLETMMAELKAKGVTIAGEMQVYDGYGKFGWIMDPENNKIELWEPVDDPLEA